MKLKQKINYIAASILVLFIITRPSVANMLLSFLLGGVLPGTNIALPFWAMLSLYLLLMAVIITRSYEKYRPIPTAYGKKRTTRVPKHA